MNILREMMILILGAGIVLSCAVGAGREEIQEKPGSQATPAKEVLVGTDRQEYKQGETIKVTIENRLEMSIFCHVGVEGIQHIERRTPDGSWEKLFARCRPPHCFSDIGPPGEMAPGALKAFIWKPLIYVGGTSKTVPAKPGQYRLLLLYQEQQREAWKSGYSNMFVIQEP
jgi:hypothetical protein